MRKPLFPLIVALSILSAIGMIYFHYFRHDCRPFKEGIGTLSRDWRGECYLTITEADAMRGIDAFTAEAIAITGPDRYKWVNGRWRPLPRPLPPHASEEMKRKYKKRLKELGLD